MSPAALDGYGGDPGSAEDELLALSQDPLIKTVMRWDTLRGEIINNPLAQLIVRRVAEEAQDAIADFLDADPSDVRKITTIQERLRFQRNLGHWLRAAKEEADKAKRTFDEGPEVDAPPD